MKKILISLLFCLFLLPLAVYADRDLSGVVLLYSEQASVGSEVVFRITKGCTNSECDKMIEYDSEVLEFKDIDYIYPLLDVGPDNGSITVISNENGILKYDFNDPDIGGNNPYPTTSIIITFTVKKVPSNGQTTIAYTPIENEEPIDYLKAEKTIEIKDTNATCNCPICTTPDDNQTTTTDTQDNKVTTECNCQKEATNTTTTGEKECKKDNTWFIIGIISLVLNALLLIVVIILATKKKGKAVVNEEKPNTENTESKDNQ